ncbi:MAG: 4-hydroxy-tetrahydrodipicolinate synthase [Mariniphaga sp.]|nr:4-hydroxy-tetrahydrodipicolinate synthase [Mariniphaga sp.]MDD4225820.1 4-hydroxy-tetrahydrodipicolinate synthase [Mariniphaga sp.]MDD4424420.1 4-hydroxy-tetrahydrodipicolinate synthase [Mariniphaga sp.]
MKHPFRGTGVALVTPFTADNTIDYKALGQIIDNQVKGGIDYLVALGTTAESSTLTTAEKADVVRFVKVRKGNLPLVVGMGGNCTRTILEQIESFNFEGVDGILVVTPYYNKPSQEGMFRHYSAIARESPVPVILYNVPTRTGVNLEAETVIRLAESNEKIVAVKEASGILSQITRINKYTPSHFSVISGDDVLAFPIVSIGGVGVISVTANALPGKVSRMIQLALEGKYDEARELHFELIELFRLLFKEGNPGGVKALLTIQGIIQNELRTPLFRISESTYREIEEAYRKLI